MLINYAQKKKMEAASDFLYVAKATALIGLYAAYTMALSVLFIVLA